jgi:hypothetical protein
MTMPSTVIRSFRYDEASQVLTITFVSGAQYRYWRVPLGVVMNFKKAMSKGNFFSHYIRDVYDFQKVSD